MNIKKFTSSLFGLVADWMKSDTNATKTIK